MTFPFLRVAWLISVLTVVARAATLAELAADPRLWPTEVVITSAARAVVLEKGQPAGAMLLGAGKKVVVTQISVEGITGKVGSTTVRMPVEKTDLGGRLEGIEVIAPEVAPAENAKASAPAKAASGASAAVAAAPSVMQRRLAGKLVRLQNGTLRAVDETGLAGVKYYALYFSASWCGPCKAFTPDLVREYQRLKKLHPEFELVFISGDNSAGAMRDYMREDRMPWPALKYEQRKFSAELNSYGGPGIPCLVLVDAKGVVLSDSYEGDSYVGPRKVLADTARILKRGS